LLVSGCASFTSRLLADVGFERWAQSKMEGGVQVSVVALTADEAGDAMGVNLARQDI
jgi:hypothetical protein